MQSLTPAEGAVLGSRGKDSGVPVAHVQKLAVAQRSQLQLDPHSQWEHAPHAAEGTQKPVLPNCNCILSQLEADHSEDV